MPAESATRVAANPTRRKTGSYYRRLAAQQALSLELQQLQAKLQRLHRRHSRKVVTQQRAIQNAMIKFELQRQQLLWGGDQGVLAIWMASPLHTYLHLPADQEQRVAYLESIHKKKMQFTVEFLQRRFQGYDLRGTYVSSQVSELPDGDSIVHVADITPLRGAKSVTQALDAFRFFAHFQEILMSEQLDMVAIREDESDRPDGINAVTESRILATDYDGSLTEKNIVVFTQALAPTAQSPEPMAVAVMDYVDCDELFSYIEGERRIRKEITSGVLFLQSTQGDATSVAMLRFCFVRLRRPDPQMLPHEQLLSRSMADRWRLVLPLAIQDRLDVVNA